MRLANVRAIIHLEMEVPENTPSGMPKNEEETENIRIVKELIRSRFSHQSLASIEDISVGII